MNPGMKREYDNIMDVGIFELICARIVRSIQNLGMVRNFASEGTLSLVENILSSNLDVGVCQMFLDNEEVDCGRSKDDFNSGVNL